MRPYRRHAGHATKLTLRGAMAAMRLLMATNAYHCGMPGSRVYWTLVFTAASLEHLAERGIHAMDVTDAAYGKNGPARVRRSGRGARQRWS